MPDIPHRRPSVTVARIPLLLVAIVLALAACSGGSGNSGGGPTAGVTGSGSPPTTAGPLTGSASGAPTAGSSAAASSVAPASGASAPAGGSKPSDPAGARAEIERDWATFFNAKTPTAKRAMLLQNGQALRPAIAALSHSPAGKGVSSNVTKVTFDSPTAATVTYQIARQGRVLLPHGTGKSVYQDGTWKVGTQSLCALLHLMPGGQGKSVPGC